MEITNIKPIADGSQPQPWAIGGDSLTIILAFILFANQLKNK